MRYAVALHQGVLLAAVFMLTACATSTSRVRTFVEPSLASADIHRVAILPIRGARLAPDESAELTGGFTRAFRAQNAGVELVEAAHAARIIDEKGLTERYAEFLRNQATTGIADSRALRPIADALEVDAIIQGELIDVQQRDGEMWDSKGRNAKTSITLKYTLIEASTGTVLWHSTASGIRHNLTPIGGAPAVLDAVTVAQERIVRELPSLGNR